MRKPHFFIAGTQKGGTTSLHNLLLSHHDIYFPKTPQEIHYFDIDKNYDRGSSWYFQLFEDAPTSALIGQTSPLYMYLDYVPARIHALLPHSKFIFVLRDPVSRAYSHYWNSVRYGYETLPFEKAIAMEEHRITMSAEHRRHYSYIDRGMYSKQILRFQKLFGPKSILILTLDEMRLDQQNVLHKCCHFLGLEYSRFDFNEKAPQVHNRSRLPRWRTLQSIRPWLDRYRFKRTTRILDFLNLQQKPYPRLPDHIRYSLYKKYESEIDVLQSMICNSTELRKIWN